MKYVLYTRVSTQEQGKSGLGLEAQMRDIGFYLSGVPHEIVGEYCDIGSGADDGRPEFLKALEMARKSGAILLVSKLDRLSRDVAVIAALMKDKGLVFKVAAMPHADNFQLHIYAALAEQERSMISMRTKAALAAAKLRGKKLGGHREGALEKSARSRMAAADKHAAKVRLIAGPMRESGQTLQQIADHLKDIGLSTRNGGHWTATAVRRVLARGE